MAPLKLAVEGNVSFDDFAKPVDFLEGKEMVSNYLLVHFIILIIISTTSMFMIGFYETYGGDVQKRTILNQLITVLCWSWVFNAIYIPTFVYRILTGPVTDSVFWYFFVLPKSIGAFYMVITGIERGVIRYLTIVVWKTVPPLDEIFFGRFFQILNLILAFVFGTMKSLGRNKEKELEFLMTGYNTETEEPVFRLYDPLFIAFVGFNVLAHAHILIMKKKSNLRIEPTEKRDSNFNTTSKNLRINMFAVHVIFLLIAIPTLLYPLFLKDSGVVLLRCARLFFIPFSLTYGVLSVGVLILNPEIVKFSINSIKCK